MRTNIDINDQLLKEAQRLSKMKTKKDTIEAALIEFVKHLKRADLLSLRGKVIWEGELSKMRTD